MTRRRILIVDDEMQFTRLVRLNLEKTGCFEVQEVNDPRQAVATAELFKPDLILLDIIMPTMDGGDVAVGLKKHPMLKEVPVICLTASIMQSEAGRQGLQSGGLLFLAKPISVHALVEAIESNLRKDPPLPPYLQSGDSLSAQ